MSCIVKSQSASLDHSFWCRADLEFPPCTSNPNAKPFEATLSAKLSNILNSFEFLSPNYFLNTAPKFCTEMAIDVKRIWIAKASHTRISLIRQMLSVLYHIVHIAKIRIWCHLFVWRPKVRLPLLSRPSHLVERIFNIPLLSYLPRCDLSDWYNELIPEMCLWVGGR